MTIEERARKFLFDLWVSVGRDYIVARESNDYSDAEPDWEALAMTADLLVAYGNEREREGLDGKRVAALSPRRGPAMTAEERAKNMVASFLLDCWVAQTPRPEAPQVDKHIERITAALTESHATGKAEGEREGRRKGIEEAAADILKAIASCEGEQLEFEKWAISQHYDMHEHPLHYLFMNHETAAARQGWKAALQHVRTLLDGAKP